jgi:LacI family gluconate utilization system Gnt-I transcriptional repressor
MGTKQRAAAPRGRRGHGAVLIEDVARLAGVSAITVSRTLNKPHVVAESTRKLVQAAVDRLGYIPNRLAGNLASTQTRTVGLVIPSLFSNVFADSVAGMTEEFGQHGYQLQLGVTDDSLDMEAKHVVWLIGQRVDGIILTGGLHHERTRQLLLKSRVPVVETNVVVAKPIDMVVGFSNEEAGYAMTRHLARCGYRRIGLVTTPIETNDRARARRDGYLRAVRQLGLVRRDNLVREAALTVAQGARAFAEMLAANPDVEAVFLAHDMLAAGAMFEASRRGLQVPGDVGICGFDDLDIAQEFVPALTTVRTPRYAIGATAARMLLQRIRGERVTARVVDMGFTIVQRASTRPSPG